MKLKPCPFCGCKKIEIYEGSDLSTLPMVCCATCPCGLEHCDFTLEQLIAAWNNRSKTT